MGKITIHSAKFLKEKAVIDYTEDRGGGLKPAKGPLEYRDAPHDDLLRAYGRLAVHAAIISEFIPASEIKDIKRPEHPELANFKVHGFYISGEDRDQIVFSMQRTLKSGKVMTFPTPLLRITEDGESAYVFAKELHEAVEKCQEEVREYLNGKIDDKQGKIDFPDDKVTKVKVLPDEQPVLGKFPSDSPNAISDPNLSPLPADGVVAETDAGAVVIPVKRSRKKPKTPENPSGLN